MRIFDKRLAAVFAAYMTGLFGQAPIPVPGQPPAQNAPQPGGPGGATKAFVKSATNGTLLVSGTMSG